MATQTSNLGLTKPAYSETADIADINNNMDKVDAAVNGVQNGMAILANGNVHSAVTSGQYVYVRNHGTLAEGLYTATTNISTNATLSTSNLTAVPNNGALNTLRDDVTSLNSKLGNVVYKQWSDVTSDTNVFKTMVSYTIPETGIYALIGVMNYSNTAPVQADFSEAVNHGSMAGRKDETNYQNVAYISAIDRFTANEVVEYRGKWKENQTGCRANLAVIRIC